MIAAIILSAGKSERMGSPKALLQFEGKMFLERILGTVQAAGIGTVVVVAGHHFREIDEAFPALALTFNAQYEKGMGTSVQAGIRALPEAVEHVGIFLVDHPFVEQETVLMLVGALGAGRIVLPTLGGRRGHPVFFSRALFPEILALGSDQGLNVVVRRDPGRVVEVPVASNSVLQDIDTRAEFENLLREKK